MLVPPFGFVHGKLPSVVGGGADRPVKATVKFNKSDVEWRNPYFVT